jgi:hypothetical protein
MLTVRPVLLHKAARSSSCLMASHVVTGVVSVPKYKVMRMRLARGRSIAAVTQSRALGHASVIRRPDPSVHQIPNIEVISCR